MINPIRALLERGDRRWQTHGTRGWERQRVGGKWLFVLKLGLLWGLMMFGGLALIGDFLDGKIGGKTLCFNLVMHLSFGLALRLFMWHEGERKYQKYLNEESEKRTGRFSRR